MFSKHICVLLQTKEGRCALSMYRRPGCNIAGLLKMIFSEGWSTGWP